MAFPHTLIMKLFPTLPLFALTLAATALAQDAPPAGFTALFNGKDLTGWRGGDTFDHRKLLAMPEAERTAKIAEWTKTMREHWRAEGGELINDGKGAYATTEKDYGDFELLVDYKTVPQADSGIYLRGVPQVQIWDSTETAKFKIGADKGSGGLWNNSPGAPGKDPLVKADKPFGEWNKFRIVMVGSRVSIWLNDQLVVDHAILENYYDRKDAAPARGPIQLQTHGGEIRWRNIFLREIGTEEANKILASHGEDAAFKSAWNGKDFDGWGGTGRELRNRRWRDPLQSGQRRVHSHEGGIRRFRRRASNSKFRPAATTASPFATPAKATPLTSACASCRCSTMTRRSTRSSIRGRSTARAYGMVAAASRLSAPDRRVELSGSDGQRLDDQGRAERRR